jgi:hypothetical protein
MASSDDPDDHPRLRDGNTITVDGPFAETRETLGGLRLIEADNLDVATERAAKTPARVGRDRSHRENPRLTVPGAGAAVTCWPRLSHTDRDAARGDDGARGRKPAAGRGRRVRGFVEASVRWPTEGPTTEQISHACTVAVGHNCGGT